MVLSEPRYTQQKLSAPSAPSALYNLDQYHVEENLLPKVPWKKLQIRREGSQISSDHLPHIILRKSILERI